MYFASPFVLTGRGDDEPENAERTSGHLDGLFFYWCAEVGLEFQR